MHLQSGSAWVVGDDTSGCFPCAGGLSDHLSRCTMGRSIRRWRNGRMLRCDLQGLMDGVHSREVFDFFQRALLLSVKIALLH